MFLRKIAIRLAFHLTVLLLVSGCGSAETKFNGGSGDAQGQFVDNFVGGVANGYRPVDIAFVVDTSGSMSEEMEKLETNMSLFVDKFLTMSEKLDYQIFFIGTGVNFPDVVSQNPKFSEVQQNVGSFDALIQTVSFLEGKFSSKLQPRKDAVQHIIVVSDDDSADMTAKDFMDESKALGYRAIHMNGFVGLKAGNQGAGCDIVNVGKVYQEISKAPEFKGLISDLCTADWSVMLTNLADSIMDEIAQNSFKLSKRPGRTDGFRVLVDGVLVPENGYTYNTDTNTINFKPSHEPKTGSKIKIYYFPV